MRSAIWLVLVACGSSSPPISTKGGVTVELASVTLADDCGDSGYRKPPAADVAGKQASQEPASESHADMAKCPPGENCGGHSRGCDQTSMQLSFKAEAAATVHVKKVELMDDGGKSIGELAARLPSKWADNKYAAWDEKLAANSAAQTSYLLAPPPWDKLGGRMQAQTKKYQLRVTVDVGGTDQTVEKQSIAPALMEPEVMTRR